MKNATFRQLRVFNEVARHLSFTKAAQALHLTPGRDDADQGA